MMKYLIKLCLLAALFCYCPNANAQTADELRLYKFDYMKVKPGMFQDYMALEKAWKKIHQHNIKAGKYSYWAVTQVVSHGGSTAEYDFVTRTSLNSREQVADMIENFSFPENMSSILSAEEMELVQRTEKIRDFVKSEVWLRNDQVLAENMNNPQVSVFNYFDFPEGGNRQAHLKVETEYWKPVHAARVADGSMKGWVLLSKMMPGGGSHEPYYDATVDIYQDMLQYMSMGNPTPTLKKVHPDKNVSDIFDETNNAADLIRSEVRLKVLDSLE